MREINHDGYKYLGMQQLDFIMNREFTEKIKNEYCRKVKQLVGLKFYRVKVTVDECMGNGYY